MLRCCLAELPLGWAAALLIRVPQQRGAGSSASSLPCEQPRHKPGPSAAMESLRVFTQFVLPCPSLNSSCEAPRLALSSPASGEGSAKALLGREDRPFPQPHGERTHPGCCAPSVSRQDYNSQHTPRPTTAQHAGSGSSPAALQRPKAPSQWLPQSPADPRRTPAA